MTTASMNRCQPLANAIVMPRSRIRGAKRRVHDLPTGADRLDTPAVGVHGVWVNSVRTVDERGIIETCGRPGRVLRDFAGGADSNTGYAIQIAPWAAAKRVGA
jgi:hypothetical protein